MEHSQIFYHTAQRQISLSDNATKQLVALISTVYLPDNADSVEGPSD